MQGGQSHLQPTRSAVDHQPSCNQYPHLPASPHSPERAGEPLCCGGNITNNTQLLQMDNYRWHRQKQTPEKSSRVCKIFSVKTS